MTTKNSSNRQDDAKRNRDQLAGRTVRLKLSDASDERSRSWESYQSSILELASARLATQLDAAILAELIGTSTTPASKGSTPFRIDSST